MGGCSSQGFGGGGRGVDARERGVEVVMMLFWSCDGCAGGDEISHAGEGRVGGQDGEVRAAASTAAVILRGEVLPDAGVPAARGLAAV